MVNKWSSGQTYRAEEGLPEGQLVSPVVVDGQSVQIALAVLGDVLFEGFNYNCAVGRYTPRQDIIDICLKPKIPMKGSLYGRPYLPVVVCIYI